jgi:hypothetical protein
LLQEGEIMSEIVDTEQGAGNWKMKVMVIGAVLGAVLGAGAAYLLVQRAEGEDGKVNVSAGDGLKIGATVIALLRQVAALGDGQ